MHSGIQGSPGHPGLSPRDGLTAYGVLSPGSDALLPPSSCGCSVHARLGRFTTASLDAQTPGVRTTRFCRTRTAPVVCALLNCSRAKPALRLLARRCTPRPPPPRPRIVTIAKRPFSLGRDDGEIRHFRISVKQNLGLWHGRRVPRHSTSPHHSLYPVATDVMQWTA
jgi:hypothetical protein